MTRRSVTGTICSTRVRSLTDAAGDDADGAGALPAGERRCPIRRSIICDTRVQLVANIAGRHARGAGSSRALGDCDVRSARVRAIEIGDVAIEIGDVLDAPSLKTMRCASGCRDASEGTSGNTGARLDAA